MYKKFALSVMLLAPILVMMVDAFTPKNDVVEQHPATPTSEAPQSATTEETPKPTPPAVMPPSTESNTEIATASPMLDPVGVDPTPVATDTQTQSDVPVSENQPSPDGVQHDTSNDDHM